MQKKLASAVFHVEHTSQVQPTMLTPEQLSARTGIAVGTLSNWRTQRNAGEDIGPRFVKLAKGRKAPVRYLIADVEEWEQRLRSEAA